MTAEELETLKRVDRTYHGDEGDANEEKAMAYQNRLDTAFLHFQQVGWVKRNRKDQASLVAVNFDVRPQDLWNMIQAHDEANRKRCDRCNQEFDTRYLTVNSIGQRLCVNCGLEGHQGW